MNSTFQLSASLQGHELDVRAVFSPREDLVVSASRDKTVRTWSRVGANSFNQEKVLLGHQHYVNSLAYFEPSDDNPNGLIISGSSDKLINISDPDKPEEPLYSLIGHEENICALSTYNNSVIVSGSWDKTAKVWKDWTCAYTLKGHTQAVWAVLAVDEETVITGSADKTIKIWKSGKCVNTLQGHTDSVRGLALVPGVGFLSCSNDSSLRLWSFAGECLQEMSGHTSFVYSVAVLPSGEFVSCGEDRSLRIWKEFQCIQTIMHPATSVWCVATSPNGDVISGSSDGVVRVFTRAEERYAEPDKLKKYNDQVASFAIPSNQVGDVKKDQLPGPEALQNPGKKDQQVLMVRVGDKVEAHQWNQGAKTWEKIGEVVDAIGQNRKQLYEGVEYDYVFDIDVGDGMPTLKLPYNVTENPYSVAQQFLFKHELPQSFLDQVANFIIQNAEGISISNETPLSDPYTGGSRYIPGRQQAQSNPQQFINPDPFTGSAAYVPQQPASTQPSNSTQIPNRVYLSLKQANLGQVFNKISSLNDDLVSKQQTDISLSNDELQVLRSAVDQLTNAKAVDLAMLQVICKISSQWPAEIRFPGLDLLRLCVLDPESQKLLSQQCNLVEFLIQCTGVQAWTAGALSKEQEINLMFGLRTLVNLFASPEGKKLTFDLRNQVTPFLTETYARLNTNNAQLSLSTLYLNYATLMGEQFDEEFVLQLISPLLEYVQSNMQPESLYRALVAIATLIKISPTGKEAATIMEAQRILKTIADHANTKIRSIASQTLAML
ncbi:PFU-domain-containing protein [Basidiobolus meristosporus CBS 931.73]|uniref:PFU-domain-containing protein n=1 Tax=Basidiobolus meristosporus CBS 931.73 TaxID=1314790 RepID=A0A1Y1YAC3_9FUNG|nr:PFU-domain-containing protein [Basidiobolus meristosporus CBS 931.73]|eukprot:ORX94957.1 PFU-domain-containing protein [Basidiobolus meristosporus CBS 931.73]